MYNIVDLLQGVLQMTKRYLQKQEKQFLIDNYSTKGIDFCSEYLNIPRKSLVKSANYLGLKLEKYNYIKDFYPITPKSAYALGFINGDGYLGDDGSISIEININDGIELQKIFNFTKWRTYTRQRKNWQEQIKFNITSIDLYYWFIKHKFNKKTYQLPDINFIPEEYIHLFILGLFDADGSIMLKKKYYGTFQISSNYDYDWSGLINILNPIVNKILRC